jgi:hypothetical protein
LEISLSASTRENYKNISEQDSDFHVNVRFNFNSNNYLEESEKRALDFALHLSRQFFGLGEFELSLHCSCFFPERLLIISRVFVAFHPRFVQNSMPLLFRIHREIASGQIRES